MKIKENPSTYCNPLNISYQYQPEYLSRESADPACIVFKGEYYLFASHGTGYWWSTDLANWNFVYSKMKQIHLFAPAACVVSDEIYISHSEDGGIYKSSNPKADEWEYVCHPISWGDPALFTDDDGRVYVYYGLSNSAPILGMELDPVNKMNYLGGLTALINQDRSVHGWEVPGDNNDRHDRDCWFEGAWMTKCNGKYYLQYASPGTEYAAYSDGCYVSDSPLGPFELAKNNPVTLKMGGFAPGAGHGSTVQDLKGNWWKFDTISISVNHMFERRLTMVPACFDEKGTFATNMVLSDYPFYTPHSGSGSFENPRPMWNLLSYGKAMSVSSSLKNFPKENAFDESIRTWWSAETGSKGEWITADLGRACDINAVQINFADQDIEETSGRDNDYIYRYLLEFSENGENWQIAVDRSNAVGEPRKALDTSHDYFEFDETDGLPKVRYVRLTNMGDVPAGGKFAVSGLRLFGIDNTAASPDSVTGFTVERLKSDRRSVKLKWNAASNAEGYIILFGAVGVGLYLHHQVIGETESQINALNVDVDYDFAIYAYGPGGIGEVSYC